MKFNRQLLALCVVLTLAWFGLSACNRDNSVQASRDDGPAVSTADQDFMMKAAQANATEIEVSRMALQKSDNIDVRDYANMIKSDHTAALKGLDDLMKDHNIPMSAAPGPDAKPDIDRMTALTGPEFDREFVNMMVADHQKAVEMFRGQSTAAQHPDLKNYVDEVLPKLEMHLDKAQRLQSKLFSVSKK